MADMHQDHAKTFLELKGQIDDELHRLIRNLDSVPEDDFSNTTYLRYTRQMDYIQGLFDDASAAAKGLQLDGSTPGLHKLLTAKAELSTSYGTFHRIRTTFFNRFTRNRGGNRESELGQDRTAFLPTGEERGEADPLESEEEVINEEECLLAEEEALLQEEVQEAKKQKRNARQKRLAEEGKFRDKKTAEHHADWDVERQQRARQEEAIRLYMNRGQGQSFSEADLRNERLRQDDARIQGEQAQIDRLQHERAVFEAYRQKIWESENFERLQKSHNDLFQEGIRQNDPKSPVTAPTDTKRNSTEKESASYQLYSSRAVESHQSADFTKVEPGKEPANHSIHQVNKDTFYAQPHSDPIQASGTTSSVPVYPEQPMLHEAPQHETELHEVRLNEQPVRQEETKYLSEKNVNGHIHSETDLRNERLCQDDVCCQVEQVNAECNPHEEKVFEPPRLKIESFEKSDHLDKSRIDLSSETLCRPKPNPPLTEPPLAPYLNSHRNLYDAYREKTHLSGTVHASHSVSEKQAATYQYVPGGVRSISPANLSDIALTTAGNNAKIYSALVTNRDDQENVPVQVSQAYETQMRFNVERARLHYAKVRGTPEAAAAAHEYIEQRRAYHTYLRDVKQGKVKLAEQIPTPLPYKHPGTQKFNNSNDMVYSFTPTGVIGTRTEKGRLGQTATHFENPGVLSRHVISPNNPLKVTPEYEAAITNQMHQATNALNDVLVGNKKSVPPETAANVKLYTDAYLGFQKAKQDGSVVVSQEAARSSPDYRIWQERQQTAKILGTTAQAKGVNPNKASKAEVEETVANIFGASSKLKQRSLAKNYFKQIGYRIGDHTTIAAYMFSRRFYNLIQEGDDNAIRTMETGRYYISSAVGVGKALMDRGAVKESMTSSLYKDNLEFKHYGATSLLSNKELSGSINEGMRLGRERKVQIKTLSKQVSELDSRIIDINAKINQDATRLNAAVAAKGGKETLIKELDQLKKQKNELSTQLSTLKKEHIQSSLVLRKEISLQKFRQKERAHNELVADLKKAGKPPRNVREMDRFIQAQQAKNQQMMAKKFGGLTKFTEKSLVKEIAQMKKQGAALKGQIKLLESRGSSLSQAERNLLKNLIDQHKELSLALRKYIGLQKARGIMDLKMTELGAWRKRLALSSQRLSAGMYALQNFMLRPLREGDSIGTYGLAKMAQIASNRYVHILVKQSFRATIFTGKVMMNLVVPGSAEAMGNAYFLAKEGAKAKARSVSKTVKTATKKGIKTAVDTTKRGIIHVTPERIKTAAHGTTVASAKAKSKFDTVATGIRNTVFKTKTWFAQTTVGRSISATRRAGSMVAHGLKIFGTAVKGFALKGAAAMIGILFVCSFIATVGTSLFGSATSTLILSPEESSENKINLAPYVEILQEKQKEFDQKVQELKNDSEYENVTVLYATGIEDNSRQMLSMMAVRMSQDLDMDENPDVEEYLNSLFDDSHYFVTSVREYQCSGCEMRSETITKENEDGTTTTETVSVPYCPGHKDLTVTITVLGFDEIFTADSYANGGQEAVAGAEVGTFTLTYYCACEVCCGEGATGITASGEPATANRTIAVDPNVIPLGTHVIINGKEYVAEDTGGAIDGNRIDIFVESHSQALTLGKKQGVKVYLAGYEGESMAETGEWNGWTDDNITWCKTIYSTDWSELYTGVPNVTDFVGTETDLSGVDFVDGERPGYQSIVDVAMAQCGNSGGQPYWSWYGFDSRVEWCAAFVSWCANQTGDLGEAFPKFAACRTGVDWFENQGQWAKPGDITPVAGDIIFFDWEQDGVPNHVGIVVGSDGDKVYTIEGNSGDQVRVMSYDLDSKDIFGYGLPNY